MLRFGLGSGAGQNIITIIFRPPPPLNPKYSKYLMDGNMIQNHVCDVKYKVTMSNIQTRHLRKHL